LIGSPREIRQLADASVRAKRLSCLCTLDHRPGPLYNKPDRRPSRLQIPLELCMPLINCPVCGHAISTEAEACPECAHPNRPLMPVRTGPKCYKCSAVATTKCQKCGAMSCVEHLQNIYVPHGNGGANELRCERCYANVQKILKLVMVVALVVLGVVALFSAASILYR
jgi:hypothetical protein